jgi:hypothetical protein
MMCLRFQIADRGAIPVCGRGGGGREEGGGREGGGRGGGVMVVGSVPMGSRDG